ncbi:Lrp/AsnC family transcriptional regulator [Roseovarius salinarum]|uniref:Lrp/AsnC family transcriptional regulator n=1 Tax=Roseovarius salinarum TaxID=1981892 RepID=UPI000C326490|nr:Lrp/AsnC family transcriptional regulator [Roseovarius salinarum]
MLDETDTRLLAAPQKTAHPTAQEPGERLGRSPSQAGRRRQRLEAAGVIRSDTARLDPRQLGLALQAFVQVQLNARGRDHARSFLRLVETRREVVSAWTLTGCAEWLLRVSCPDLGALNALVHDVLLPHDAVDRVHSRIVMDQCKSDAPLPT